jgi:hypothetical protein
MQLTVLVSLPTLFTRQRSASIITRSINSCCFASAALMAVADDDVDEEDGRAGSDVDRTCENPGGSAVACSSNSSRLLRPLPAPPLISLLLVLDRFLAFFRFLPNGISHFAAIARLIKHRAFATQRSKAMKQTTTTKRVYWVSYPTGYPQRGRAPDLQILHQSRKHHWSIVM